MPNYIEETLKKFDELSPEMGKWRVDRNKARKFLKDSLTSLLLKCKEAVPPENKYINDNYTTDRERDLAKTANTYWNSCRSTTLQNLDNLEK